MHTSNKRKSKTWAALILSGMLLFSLHTPSYAAESNAPLPKPAWTSSSLALTEVNTEKDVIIKELNAVPSKNLVYVHSSQPVIKTSSNTKLDWQLDSLQALDATTGQLKWNVIFHEKSGPYTTYSNSLYSSYGTAYVYMEYSDGTKKVYSYNTSGKTNWVKTVNNSSSIYLLDNDTLLVASSAGVQSNGSVRSAISLYDKKGKLITEKTINGAVLKAGSNRIVVDASKQTKVGNYWQAAANPKVEIYDRTLNRLSFYQFPSNANTLGDGGGESLAILDDGSVIMRANFENTGNKLMGFGTDGKMAWGRAIAGNAYVQTAGSGYTVFTGQKLELYTMKGKVTERTFKDQQEPLMAVERTQDENYKLNFAKSGYILDPQTLETVHEYAFATTPGVLDGYSTYSDHIIYQINDDALSKYVLKTASAK
ncbi:MULTISPECIES: hypothetical protein [unclassified Paenibacillus]|uniref:hypothetical protein n=1 Tax=unclassified Paenibacillus TaxID=185978 RepID=UPI000424801B|nr:MULTISPECIES: hypothetical protein [unclassified Paenibacillus]KGP79019.1 hypothetical protein P364_0125990 [Paenibacillus sp. MAEPY2]KGP88234.1 hypothetical protein P363_0107635 [Paenibacillus sp. MAEPY1]